MAKKYLSKDLQRLYAKLKEIAQTYGVQENPEYRRVDDIFSRWVIDCIVEESLTPKGEAVNYKVIIPDESIDFREG